MSDSITHYWITFQRQRFLEQTSAIERVFTTIADSDYWLSGLDYDVESDRKLYTYRT